MTPDATLRAFALIFALLGVASMVIPRRYAEDRILAPLLTVCAIALSIRIAIG